jgi:L-iditol 2-dehydrogenase
VSATLQLAMHVVRPGGQIVKVGWGPQHMAFNLDPIVQKNVSLQGSFSHNWPIWERVLSMMASGQLDLGPIVSRTAPLEDWQGCFEGMHAGAYVKTVLLPFGTP